MSLFADQGRVETLEKLKRKQADEDWAARCRDAAHVQAMVHAAAGLRLDLSRSQLATDTMSQLLSMAEQVGLAEQRRAQWAAEPVNRSEGRPVLHGALRSPGRVPAAISEIVRRGDAELNALLQHLDQACPDHAVLHIGIGGSDLGPRLAASVAGQPRRPLFFLNNLDEATVADTLGALDPARTLVVVVSKSFSTAETSMLYSRVTSWFQQHLVASAEKVVAVTANPQRARDEGIQQVLEFPHWVGGRYSVWSAVSFSLALAYGGACRDALLAGAADMDEHFLTAPLAQNLPVLAALVGVWQRNVLGLNSRVVTPYADRLYLLPAYLQQLEMESNGKRVGVDGHVLGHATAPVTLGGVGSCAQHAFFQLLHQSADTHPVEFVVAAQLQGSDKELHRSLLSNALAQACALTQGRAAPDGDDARACPGGRPSTMIALKRLDVRHLGALLAFYEHRTAVQGWLWGINSYDQYGVELGKTIAKDVEQAWTGSCDFPDASCAAAAGWLDDANNKLFV